MSALLSGPDVLDVIRSSDLAKPTTTVRIVCMTGPNSSNVTFESFFKNIGLNYIDIGPANETYRYSTDQVFVWVRCQLEDAILELIEPKIPGTAGW